MDEPSRGLREAAAPSSTGITQTGASGGAAVGPLVFGLVAEAASYQLAWFICGAFALGALAAIVAGRRMILRDRRAFAQGTFDARTVKDGFRT